jgi:hypothetical protein
VVIHDLDIVSVTRFPAEANAPLIVDPNAPLSRAITSKPLKAVSRWNSEIVQGDRSVELPQLAQCDALDICSEPLNEPAVEELLGILASEAPDHRPMITSPVTMGKW